MVLKTSKVSKIDFLDTRVTETGKLKSRRGVGKNWFGF